MENLNFNEIINLLIVLSLAAAVALDREILFLLKSGFVSYTSRKMRS